jgi:catechol 2,3-dioxygenase-like lactoylglutathione lyase family enzyme
VARPSHLPADTVFKPVTVVRIVSDPTPHHVGVTVADLDRAVDFYTETFGLDVAAEFAVGGEAFADAVAVDGASADFAHLVAGGGDDRTVVELVAYEPEGEPTEDPELNRPGAIHIGLSVDDVREFYRELDDDVETLSEPRTTESGTTILFVVDPDGNLIEVLDA